MFGHEKDKCCGKSMGLALLVLGVFVMLNEVYSWVSWAVFIGAVIAVKGIVMMVKSKK